MHALATTMNVASRPFRMIAVSSNAKRLQRFERLERLRSSEVPKSSFDSKVLLVSRSESSKSSLNFSGSNAAPIHSR